MKDQTPQSTSNVYPGLYVPLLNGDDIAKKKMEPSGQFLHESCEKIIDLGDSYNIALSLHGLKKKDFLVELKGKVLSIKSIPISIVLNRAQKIHPKENTDVKYYCRKSSYRKMRTRCL